MGKKISKVITVRMTVDEKWSDAEIENTLNGSLKTWLKAKDIEIKVSR